jgi:ADP-heptose:LPS heptosyltransferase
MQHKLQQAAVDTTKGYLIFHPGVSEEKRKYPRQSWITVGQLAANTGLPILLTGTAKEGELTSAIAAGIGPHAIDMAGRFTTGEFIALTAGAAGIVSVNTATIHIAAACKTPVVVLYALTNPQHTPWKVCGKIFPFKVPDNLQSSNEVIRFARKNRMIQQGELPQPAAIVQALESLLQKRDCDEFIAPDTLIL